MIRVMSVECTVPGTKCSVHKKPDSNSNRGGVCVQSVVSLLSRLCPPIEDRNAKMVRARRFLSCQEWFVSLESLCRFSGSRLF
jgi:hypothetical protein